MLPWPMDFDALSQEIGQQLSHRDWVLATAESCTGGWVAQAITSCPGSSRWFERGFVTYSNLSKQELLGVNASILSRHGAVSEPVVRALAEGALARSHAQVSLAVTGVAGPAGGTPEKPVGTVWLAWAGVERLTLAAPHRFTGARDEIRRQAVEAALRGLLRFIQS